MDNPNILSTADFEAINAASSFGYWKYYTINDIPMYFYADKVMDDLLGIEGEVSPTERHEFYINRIYPADVDIVQEYTQNLLKTPTEVEYRYMHPKKGLRLVRCFGMRGQDENGRPIIIGRHQDITDSVHLRYQADNTDHTLARLTQRLYAFNVTIDPNTGQYTLIKGTGMDAVVDILAKHVDYQTAHLLIMKNVHPAYVDQVSEMVSLPAIKKKLDRRGLLRSMEFPVVYPNSDKLTWHEVSVFIDVDIHGSFIVNIMGRDTTDVHELQEKSARELQAISAHNRILSDLTRMLYSYNINVNLTTGQYSLIEGTGMTKAMEVFRSTTDYATAFNSKLPLVMPGFKKDFIALASLEALRSHMDEQGLIGKLEYGATTEQGEEWHEANVFISTDEDGSPIANILGRDITQSHNEADTKMQLEIANASNMAKTNFLFNMSHDIRTPMNAIIGFTELLEKHIDDKALAVNYLHKIQVSNKFLLSLINNVLEMARIESGKITLEENCINANVLNDTVTAVFDAQMRQKNMDFRTSINVQHSYIMCDSTKLHEVFLNILSNALKYTPSGGRVTLDTTEIPSTEPGIAIYRTTCTDTGIGMSAEFLPHLFEEFTREHTTTESQVAGTGLGMPIVKRLVDLMNGTIEVKSELGKGTTFIITMPHRIADGADEETLPNTITSFEEGHFKGCRILLAEDNELNAEIAITVLEEAGFQVEHAIDGAECIDLLKRVPSNYYDIILMDIQMPNIDGYEATRIIRSMKDPVKANIPIVAMTANAFDEDKRNALEAGMNAHLAKPIEIPKLATTLTQILR